MKDKILALQENSTIVRTLVDALPDSPTLFGNSINLVGKVSNRFAAKLALELFRSPLRRKKILKGEFENMPLEHIEVLGERVRYYEHGNGPKKILLVHGWESGASDFFRLIENWGTDEFTFVTFDHIAHGFSSGRHTTALDVEQILKTLFKRHGSFHAIVAHSFGGLASVRALAQNPELEVEHMITIGSPNKLTKVMNAFKNIIGLDDKIFKGLEEEITKRFQIEMENIATGNYFSDVNARGLVVHDVEDKQVSIESAREISRDSGVELKETTGLGHNRILRDPELLDDLKKRVS